MFSSSTGDAGTFSDPVFSILEETAPCPERVKPKEEMVGGALIPSLFSWRRSSWKTPSQTRTQSLLLNGEKDETGGLQQYGNESTRDSDGKESTCSVGDLDSIPRLGRSPGEGNSMDLPS